ncbi:MAG: hypothetical protein R3B84_19790 [Zavarzinella sp.]
MNEQNEAMESGYGKTIKIVSWVGLVLAAVISASMFYYMNFVKADDVDFARKGKELIAYFLLPVGGFITGMAGAITCAPASYLKSPQGAKWLKVVGTKSIIGARVAASVVTLLGIAFFTLLVVLVITDDFKKPLFG